MTIARKQQRAIVDYRQRLNYIIDLCMNAEDGKLGQFAAWRSGRKIFDVLDWEKIAKCCGEDPIQIFDPRSKVYKYIKGPVLTQSEIADVIIRAINEKEPERCKGGLKDELVTTNHILFQFYLIKIALRAATK